MNFAIVHLSDLHFGNPAIHLTRKDVGQALDSILAMVAGERAMLVISGDVTFQGQAVGYEDAIEHIFGAIDRNGISPADVLMCPGNHDIVAERNSQRCFSTFDAWSSRIRGDSECTYAGNPARFIQNDIGDFLLLNTAHHLDYAMGLVDIEFSKKTIESFGQLKEGRLRIAIGHHHLVPVLAADTSTTRNAYDLLQLLDEHNFSAYLHGHQHAVLNLSIGQHQMRVSGIGSFGFTTAGYMNTVAVYRGQGNIIDSVEYFGLSLDSKTGIAKINI